MKTVSIMLVFVVVAVLLIASTYWFQDPERFTYAMGVAKVLAMLSITTAILDLGDAILFKKE